MANINGLCKKVSENVIVGQRRSLGPVNLSTRFSNKIPKITRYFHTQRPIPICSIEARIFEDGHISYDVI